MDSKGEQLISTRPYVIRAIREWAMDNGLTPQLLVDAGVDGIVIPEGYAQDGKIVLNVHTLAVQSLELGNDFITFSARFGGASHAINLPIQSVLAVFARENGQGIFFQEGETQRQFEQSAGETEDSPPNGQSDRLHRRPNLRLVE
jgi:stringent starvation protein B